VGKIDEYQHMLRHLENWDDFLLAESGLPGPRGNLELAQAVAEEGNRQLFEHLLTFDAARAPTNTPQEFLAFCGVVGLGRLAAQGEHDLLPRLQGYACDPRWRMSEGVAMALQRLGDADMDRLLLEMEAWSAGSWLEQRAAVAGLAEPRLLGREEHMLPIFHIFDRVTAALEQAGERKSDGFIALRKGLGYAWSVVAAAYPAEGKRRMECWFASTSRDVRWVMKENLKKNRLIRMDPEWVERWKIAL
jgi:hypothetical protein